MGVLGAKVEDEDGVEHFVRSGVLDSFIALGGHVWVHVGGEGSGNSGLNEESDPGED